MLDSRSDFHKFHDVYRGCKTYFEMDTFKYSLKVKARIRAVNIFGVGDPSEEVILETSKGTVLASFISFSFIRYPFIHSFIHLLTQWFFGRFHRDPSYGRSCLMMMSLP